MKTTRTARRGWSRLLGTFTGHRREQEFADEFDSHIAMQTEDNIRAGMSADDARRAAILKFGSIASSAESLRDQRGLPRLEILLKDLSYAWRGLVKSPSFTLVVVLTLAVGIGANTAMFSLVNQVLLHPRGVDRPDRLAAIRERYTALNLGNINVSPPTFADARDSRQIFEHTGAYQDLNMNYSGGGAPQKLLVDAVTVEWFSVFGAKPHLGRVFVPEEDQPKVNRVAVLSYSTWTRLFGADPSVLNRTIELDLQPYRIIGVMEPGFEWPRGAELWIPLGLTPALLAPANHWNENISAVARLQPGVSIKQADAWMNTLSDRLLHSDLPNVKQIGAQGWSMFVMPFMDLNSLDTKGPVLILLGAVGLLLLIASSNVAGLMLARNSARSHEVSLQAALGASRGRLLSRAGAESLILAVLGGMGGLAIAYLGIRAALIIAPEATTQGLGARLDIYSLFFTAAIVVASGVFFGMLPAWRASRAVPGDALRGISRSATTGKGGQRLRSALVVAEASMALVLLVGAGVFLRSLSRLQNVNPGFSSHGVMTATLSLPQSQYSDGQKEAAFYRDVLDRLSAAPGVTAASMALGVPFHDGNNSGGFEIENHPLAPNTPAAHTDIRYVSPGFLGSLTIPLKSGRFFSDQDRFDGDRVVVIDESLAREYWPGQDPVGTRIRRGTSPWFTVVGVIGHVLQHDLSADTGKGVLYFSLYQFRPRLPLSTILVKTAGDPVTMVPVMRDAVRAADPNLPLYDVKSVDDMLADSLSARRFVMRMMAFFAVTALFLAALGLYGVINYGVVQRTREIGIRVALGAGNRSVLQLVIWQGVRLAAVGMIAGLIGVAAMTQIVQSQLFGVSATDPAIAALAIAVLLGVALLASYLPARRATRIDPLAALRCE